MNHKQLVTWCVKVLDSFDPEIQGVREHLKASLLSSKGLEEGDELFLVEVFSGCVQYNSILKVVVDGYYIKDGRSCLGSDKNLYVVLSYLTLFRLEELGIAHFKKFILVQDTNKMYKFLKFMLDEGNIMTWIKAEWCKLYDQSYVQQSLVGPLLSWLPELKDILAHLMDKVTNKEKQRQPKPTTEVKPFNLTKPKPRSVAVPEKIPKLKKHSKVPGSTYKPPTVEEKLSKIKEENRRRAEEALIGSSARQLSCASAEKSAKTRERMNRIKAEEEAKLDFNRHRAKEMPSQAGNVPVKLNAAAILREGIIFHKKEEEELKKLADYEMGGRDASDFEKWQETMRKKDLDQKLTEIERKRLEGKLSYEEAILARQNLISENREKVNQMKEETEDMMREYLKQRLREEKEMRELVENTIENHKNAIEAKQKLTEYKQKLVQEVTKESRELMRRALEEAEEEMRQRVALIAKIRAIESVPVIRFKYVDLTETAGAGLLNEMSIAELRERLALLKDAQKEDEEKRRDEILQTKVEKDQKLMDTLEIISKYRAEKGKQAAVSLEEKRQKSKPEVKDAKVAELQKKLETRKAERIREKERLAIHSTKASARRQKELRLEKKAIEEMRWKELENTRLKAAKLQSSGSRSGGSSGGRPDVNALITQMGATKLTAKDLPVCP